MERFQKEKYIAQLSIDCVIFGYKNKELKVLISKLSYGEGLWSLPGGYILKTESIDEAASRILKERTGLNNIYLEQFRAFGGKDRIIGSEYREMVRSGLKSFDPDRFDDEAIDWVTDRFVCLGYYALVDLNKVNPKMGEFEEFLKWEGVEELPHMTHDHNSIVAAAHKALRQNLDEQLIGFNLLPETFTMKEVKELYEAVYDKEFPMNNFQKKILGLQVLERLGKKYTGAQNRAPYLYRFKK
ncbi:NUDIX hydrolase [Flagellimonas okinawensis]|uniref:NUDIX domain-containing protein n=1 Tax=Flagellimonas okinawensis TaxID=3031324 RepID=A0ABT5XTH2_9FLAO|nr:NUDIX domain-containing protein [[Muricauda] okinawensis]MDF0709203.1 NUDIX domain-containing protein [[Muricauda] okinawensis]